MSASKTKILFGKYAETGFGKKGSGKGMYSGGFNYYVYGLWPFISITHYTAWGNFTRNNPNL